MASESVHSEVGAFPVGSLEQCIRETATRALRDGALEPIPTHAIVCQERNVRFMVRLVSNLQRKPHARHGHNPFLPYEQALHVADSSASHACILNKYNVVDQHLLIITRAFEHQETLLTEADFHALRLCLQERASLGFYNSGRISGASQTHKHLQVVPLPLIPPAAGGHPTLDVMLDSVAATAGAITRVGDLPFRHALVHWHPGAAGDADQWAVHAAATYRHMLTHLQIPVPPSPQSLVETPYNLLVTSRWMLLVPRRRECFHSISLNALAFVGALLARDTLQLDVLRRAGLRTVLQAVAQQD